MRSLSIRFAASCLLFQFAITAFSGETALVHAARQGHTATAKYLIDHGADPTIASNLGTTALHHAAGIGLSCLILCCDERNLLYV